MAVPPEEPDRSDAARRSRLAAALVALTMACTAARPPQEVQDSMFSRIDTVIIRVRNVDRAAAWYREKLGLEPISSDAGQRLVVLRVAADHTLTLWQLGADDIPAPAGFAVAYPILAVGDAARARSRLVAAGVLVTPLEEAPGIRYFSFTDLDGNRLEACESH